VIEEIVEGFVEDFVEQPGRYTFNEAFFAKQVALIYRWTTYFPEPLDQVSDERHSIVVGSAAKAA